LHTGEGDFADGETTPRTLREIEAEARGAVVLRVFRDFGALISGAVVAELVAPSKCCDADTIPEESAQKIFRTSDQIIVPDLQKPTEMSACSGTPTETDEKTALLEALKVIDKTLRSR
jgi:hypothetical protein